MKNTWTKVLFVFLFVGLVFGIAVSGQSSSETSSADPDLTVTETMEDEATKDVLDEEEIPMQEPNLPLDTTPLVSVKEIRISGNTLIPAEEIFETMPQIYNASDQPLLEAESRYLYDFRILHKVVSDADMPQDVSLRTIEGLVQYILSLYQDRDYAGVYVFVPRGAIDQEKMEVAGGILPIKVIEAPVYAVDIKYYGADQNEVGEAYLRRSVLEKWSPVKIGRMANQKSLDYFVNLLNLNPDRHVSVLVSKGADPNTLKVQYDVYETNPWHYFVQVDNSGTNERQWSPRAGIINTNLLGIDDRFTAVYQAKPDSTIDDNYSIYGSYDLPVLGPRLRLNIYSGHSEFDINPESGIFDFLGRGSFYGAMLRYNVLQSKGWFFNVTGSFSHERSKVTPSLFPTATSDVEMDLFGVGAELSRSNDISNTALSLNIVQSITGSSRRRFQLARTQADPDFSIYSISAGHNQYIDENKYHQLKSNCRWVTSDERLVPAKMTSFGGMYSVRGYDEYEVVADGGLLASIQYEFDWLRYNQAVERAADSNEVSPADDMELTKLTPLVFMDYGRSDIKDSVAGEKPNVTLWSVGLGTVIELGGNLSGACYYGYPLRKTDDTREGKGRISVSFMLRW
jgi:hemolysin activation/secretion protein